MESLHWIPRLIIPSILTMTYGVATAQDPSGDPISSRGNAPSATVHIIHGYSASPSDHWFSWLKRYLAADGHAVTIHPMPDSDAPDVNAWRRTLEDRIPVAGPRTFFVAHSLGCISLLHYLSARPEDASIGGIVLVSGFSQPIASLPELDAFTGTGVPFDSMKALTPRRVVIASENDPIVPFEHTVHLQKILDARLITVERGGHFLASDGFTEHPAVLRALKQMITDATKDEDPQTMTH